MADWTDRLYQGDCIELMRQWADAGHRADLVLADPPYNIGFRYDVYQDNLSDDEYCRWTQQWMAAAYALLKADGTFWVAIGDEYVAELKRLAESVGFHIRSWVVWYYTFGVHCTNTFTRSHTHFLYFVKDPKRFTFNADAVRVPSARQLVYNDRRADARGRLPDNTWILRPHDAPEAFLPEHDTWYFARVAGTFRERAGFHGCQLPERLLERIIRSCSNEGEVVVDPFAGSGSTLIVAKKLGRRFVGCELSPDYVRHARTRLDQVRCGDPIEGPEDAVSSARPTPGFRRRARSLDDAAVATGVAGLLCGESAEETFCRPERHVRFLDACGREGLPCRTADWNRALLEAALEETGQSEPDCGRDAWDDRAGITAEMALRSLQDRYAVEPSEVLCRPNLLALFEDCTRWLAPGVTIEAARRAALACLRAARASGVSEDVQERLGRLKAHTWELSRMADWANASAGVFLLLCRPAKPSRSRRKRAAADRESSDAFVPVLAASVGDLRAALRWLQHAEDRWATLLPFVGTFVVKCTPLPEEDAPERSRLARCLAGRTTPLLNVLPRDAEVCFETAPRSAVAEAVRVAGGK